MSRAETGPQEFAYACILILWCLTPLCVIGYADQLGSGVRNLFKYSKHYSGREPEFIEGDVFRIIVPLDDVYSDTGNVQTTQAIRDTTQATQAVVGADCSIETRIMNVMLQKPTISQKEIASLLQENPNTVKYYIRKLKEVGRIERQGSSQKGKWVVK